MATNPVFTDPGAYNAPVPATTRVADRSPIADSVGRIGESLERLGTIIYQQEQQDAILTAQILTADGFLKLQQRTDQETDFTKMHAVFQTGAEEIQKEAFADVKDEKTRQAIEFHFLRERMAAEIHVQYNLTKKKAAAGYAKINTRADQIFDSALLSPDIHLIDQKAAIIEMGRLGRSTGALDANSEQRWVSGHLQAMDVGYVQRLIEQNPALAKQLLIDTTKREGKDAFTNFTDLREKRPGLVSRAGAGAGQRSGNVDEMVKTGLVNIYKGGNAEKMMTAIIAEGATQRQIKEARGAFRAAATGKDYFDRISIAPPAEAAMLESEYLEKVAAGDDPYLVEGLGRFQNQLRAMKKLWQEDPALAADTFFPMKQPPEGAKVTEAQRIAQRIAAYKAKGLHPTLWQPLPKAQAEEFVHNFNASDTDGKITSLRNIMVESGPYKNAVVEQLRDEELPFYAGTWVQELSTAKFRDLVEAHSLSEADLAKLLQDAGLRKDFREEAIERFNDGFGATIPPGSPVADRLAFQNTFIRLALLYSQRGVGDPADAAEKTLWGGYIFRDSMRIPIADAPNAGNIQAKGVAVLDGLTNYNLYRGAPGSEAPKDVYMASVQSEGKWHLSDNDTVYRLYRGITKDDLGILGNRIWGSKIGTSVLEPVIDADKLKENLKPGMSVEEVKAAFRAAQIQFTLLEGQAFGPVGMGKENLFAPGLGRATLPPGQTSDYRMQRQRRILRNRRRRIEKEKRLKNERRLLINRRWAARDRRSVNPQGFTVQ